MATFSTIGADTASSTGTSVTGGANTKGSYVQITASSAITANSILSIGSWAGTATTVSNAFDVATGAASSEVVLLGDLPQEFCVSGQRGICYYNQLNALSSGTRIAVRMESSSVGGSEIISYSAVLCDTSIPAITSPTYNTYGVTLGSDDKLPVIEPGGTANTKGAYTEIASSVSATAQWFYLVLGNNRNNTMSTANWLVDIATGAAASEVVLIANLHVATHSIVDMPQPVPLGPFPAADLQSQRVAVRAQCDITDASDRLITAAIMVTSGTAAGGGSASGARNPLVGPVGP